VIGTDEEEVYNHTRHGWHKAAFFSFLSEQEYTRDVEEEEEEEEEGDGLSREYRRYIVYKSYFCII
jgi:hypothetical protein